MPAENSGKTARGRPFKPGQSGNPGGRPKIPEDVKMAFRAACPEAVEILIGIMRNPKEKTPYRLDAIKTILDRAYGKPEVMSKVEMSGQIQPVVLFRWMTEEETSTMTAQNAEINSLSE